MSAATIHEALCDALEAGGLGIVRSPVPFGLDGVPEHLAGKVFALRIDERNDDGEIGSKAMVRRAWVCALHYRLTQDPSGGIQAAMGSAEAAVAVVAAALPDGARTDTGPVVWSYPADGHHAVAEFQFTTDSYESV